MIATLIVQVVDKLFMLSMEHVPATRIMVYYSIISLKSVFHVVLPTVAAVLANTQLKLPLALTVHHA